MHLITKCKVSQGTAFNYHACRIAEVQFLYFSTQYMDKQKT